MLLLSGQASLGANQMQAYSERFAKVYNIRMFTLLGFKI
jgi:hypothetical protein